MKKEASKAERTRRFIIESTAEIFNKKGYAGTSMSDLTEATKLTKGSIYGNFLNKEEVATAVFDHNLDRVLSKINQEMAKSDSFSGKLLAYVRVYDNFLLKSFPSGGCPILNTAIEADDTNPVLKQLCAAAVRGWKKKIEDLIASGISSGEFRNDADKSRAALSIIALIEGAVMISKITESQANMDKVMTTVEEMILSLKK